VQTSNGKVVALSLDVTDKDASRQAWSPVSRCQPRHQQCRILWNGVQSLDSEASESAMKEVEVNYIAPLRIVQSFSHESQRQDQHSHCQHCFHRQPCQFRAWGDLFGLESCCTFLNASAAT
jgi:endonuclease I